VTTDFSVLPPDLPAPQDDGAADHLPGMRIPALTLESSAGPVDLAELASGRAVIYLYPKTGTPGETRMTPACSRARPGTRPSLQRPARPARGRGARLAAVAVADRRPRV
jgi:hypothetical protein